MCKFKGGVKVLKKYRTKNMELTNHECSDDEEMHEVS